MQRYLKKKKSPKPKILFRKLRRMQLSRKRDVILVYAELLIRYRKQFYNFSCYVDLKCNLVSGNFFTMLFYN